MKNDNLNIVEILKHLTLATAIYDNSELRIAFANPAMLDMWCASSTIIGKRFGDVFPSFKKEGFERILKEVWNTGVTYRATDTPAVIVNGTEKHARFFDFEYKAMLDSAGKTYAILHTATDVTERKLTKSQLHIREEQLSFNSELETLTYTLSHDVMNPLSIAKMGLSYLQNNKEIPAETHDQWVDTVSNALENIENIITQTAQLSKARLIANHQTVHDIAHQLPVWCEEIQLLYPKFKGSITMETLLPIYGDIGAIYQIFLNIISNALKYSSNLPNAAIAIYSKQVDNGVVYFIKDNGIGIPESELDNVFCVYRRASNASTRKGNGIGLCLVKRIIERYSGSINISSEEGKGTLVKLMFPN